MLYLRQAVHPRNWIQLDSQSTVDVFSDASLLTNIQDTKWVLTLHCNVGKAIVTQKGDLRRYGMVCYYPKGIVNILSLHKVQKNYKVTSNSSAMTGFLVHKSDGTSHMFTPSKKGLFFSDVKHNIGHILINAVNR